MWHSDRLQAAFDERCNKAVMLLKENLSKYDRIGVFGSYARGDYKTTSDIDMCVIVSEIPDRYTKGLLYEELDLIGVDLCFILSSDFQQSETPFMQNLRRDFKEVSVHE